MNVFSTNQARQLYVMEKYEAPTADSKAGTLTLKTDTAKNHLYLSYKGVDSLMRSDLIDIKNILYAKANDAANMAIKLKKYTITLNSKFNSGAPIVGQDYIVRIPIKGYLGMSDEDMYFKHGMVHVYNTNASTFYKTLAVSLAKNFCREPQKLVKIELTTTDSSVEVTGTTNIDKLTDTYTNVVVSEVEQPWVLGKFPLTGVDFKVEPLTVTYQGTESTEWATITKDTAGTVNNGKIIADLEYFCMGERGDIYRGAGYPNNINTKYLVDETKPYYTFDVHYAYVGSNESVQKSEKDLTVVCATKDTLNSLINAFTTATGMTVATL